MLRGGTTRSRPTRPNRVGDRPRHLAARRRLGHVEEPEALAVLGAATEAGVTLLRHRRRLRRRPQRAGDRPLPGRTPELDVTVATKMGRRVEQVPEAYTLANFRAWTDRSRANLGVDVLDLVQLHCPPTAVFADDAVFDALDSLVAEQRIRGYGVSVETCDQALTAIARPGVVSVQIILNAFRQKPLDEVLPAAPAAGVGDHRPGAAGLRAAVGQVQARHHVRRRRPPQLQPGRRGLRRRRDVRRGGLRHRRGRRPPSSASWPLPGGVRRPRRRCAGCSTSPGSAR